MKFNKSFYSFFFSALILLGVNACGKDDNKGSSSKKDGGYDPVISELTESNINGSPLANNVTVAGVFTDAKTGEPIPGVCVTDGYKWCKTDANGVYQMAFNQMSHKVYYTTPAAYKINLNSDHVPAFYAPSERFNESKALEYGKKYRIDFKLEALEAPETNWTLIAIGDPQCKNASETARYVTETIPDIKKTSAGLPSVYAVTLGDIVFDSNTWYSLYNAMKDVEVDGRYIPFFQCMGNHDHNAINVVPGADRLVNQHNAQDRFVQAFGPPDYSFDRGNAHIVVMDDVWVVSRTANSSPNGFTCDYYTGFTDEQWTWFRDDIANVENPENKLLFFCVHIPFRSGGNNSSGTDVNNNKHYADFLKQMQKFHEAHILIGHTHYQQNYMHTSYATKSGRPIEEHIHCAACGAWWANSSSVTGAPNGYNVYNVTGNTVQNWRFKGTNRDKDYQLRVFNGDTQFGQGKSYPLYWYNGESSVGSFKVYGYSKVKNSFVAEIFNDDDSGSWKVEFWQNGSKVGDFTKIPSSANPKVNNIPMVSHWFNEIKKTTDTYTNRTASHYWYYKPASGNPAAETGWEVRAKHVIPSSGEINTFVCSKFSTGSGELRTGTGEY